MKKIRYEFILRATRAVAHHQETLGNLSVFMRESVRLPGGRYVEVPYITGDCIRHGLRESAADAYLDAAGLSDDPCLTEASLRLLYAGGMITGAGGNNVRLDDYRKMTELMPPLALLGGCAQNRSIPGKMSVDSATLLCDEMLPLLPEWVGEWLREHEEPLKSFRSSVEMRTRVRMDPVLSPEKRQLLAESERKLIEGRLAAHEAASEDGDDAGKDASKSTMMPRSFEAVKRGSLFFWSVDAKVHSELEEDTFNVMVGCWLSDAKVGGKAGTKHGLLEPLAAQKIGLARPSESLALVRLDDAAIGRIFRDHVGERKDRIREFLAKVDA